LYNPIGFGAVGNSIPSVVRRSSADIWHFPGWILVKLVSQAEVVFSIDSSLASGRTISGGGDESRAHGHVASTVRILAANSDLRGAVQWFQFPYCDFSGRREPSGPVTPDGSRRSAKRKSITGQFLRKKS